jgi:large repetitive protein
VTPTPMPPRMPACRVSLVPASLPAATIGKAYRETLTPSGGVPPYSMFVTVNGGAVPPGMTFSTDTLTGVPTTSGSFPFTVAVVDSMQCSAFVPYTITVSPAPSCPLMVASGNVFLTYKGTDSGCGNTAEFRCLSVEPIQFTAAAIGYDFDCSTHAFTWNFGDGSFGSGASAIHAYTQSGTYPVTLTIANSQQALQLTTTITVEPPRRRTVRR